MKKYNLIFTIVLSVLILAKSAFATNAAKKEVIIFSQPCHYCDLMKEDLNAKIISDNPDINFIIIDISQSENHKTLRKYVSRYKLNPNQIGLPLLFIGDNYMMGWNDNAKQEIQEYIEILKQEKISRIPEHSAK